MLPTFREQPIVPINKATQSKENLRCLKSPKSEEEEFVIIFDVFRNAVSRMY